MRVQEAAQRYAKALFVISTENKSVEATLHELRELNSAIQKDQDLKSFFSIPTIKSIEQKKVFENAFAQKKLRDEIRGLIFLLVEKRRMSLLPQISSAFQAVVDASKGVDRGVVRSASTLFPEDRARIETIISRYTRKKAVLEYQEDRALLGGLVAQVGSYTLDDSLETQLRLMKEALKKGRAN